MRRAGQREAHGARGRDDGTVGARRRDARIGHGDRRPGFVRALRPVQLGAYEQGVPPGDGGRPAVPRRRHARRGAGVPCRVPRCRPCSAHPWAGAALRRPRGPYDGRGAAALAGARRGVDGDARPVPAAAFGRLRDAVRRVRPVPARRAPGGAVRACGSRRLVPGAVFPGRRPGRPDARRVRARAGRRDRGRPARRCRRAGFPAQRRRARGARPDQPVLVSAAHPPAVRLRAAVPDGLWGRPFV